MGNTYLDSANLKKFPRGSRAMSTGYGLSQKHRMYTDAPVCNFREPRDSPPTPILLQVSCTAFHTMLVYTRLIV